MKAHLQNEDSNKRYTNDTYCHLRPEAKRPSGLPTGSSISEFSVLCMENSVTEASTVMSIVSTTFSGCNQADTYQHLQTPHWVSLATRFARDSLALESFAEVREKTGRLRRARIESQAYLAKACARTLFIMSIERSVLECTMASKQMKTCRGRRYA